MATAVKKFAQPIIAYPDSDGEPMAENTLQFKYYIYDPDQGTLKGWLRVGDHLEAVPNMAGFVSPGLGIRFEPGEGPDNLKIFKPDGTPFLTYVQLAEDLEAAQHRLESERAAGEADRERAERYAAKLRELGIEPD